jgi:hypothetical protein
MDIESLSVFIFMKFQEHGYIRGYYTRIQSIRKEKEREEELPRHAQTLP